jgi:hypothetical protein
VLKQENNDAVMDQKKIEIANDHTWPQLLKATSDKGHLIFYPISQPATSSAIASSSAKTGMKLISNTKGPFTITFFFSEAVKEGNTDNNDELVFSSSDATISATLNNPTSQQKFSLEFEDRANHKLLGELQFVYDAVAPKLGELYDTVLWEQSKENFFFTFTSSEPLSFARATVNGVTKTATGGPKYYRVDKLPLNVGDNIIKIMAQDQAGNTTTSDLKVTMNSGAPASYPINSDGSPTLPENVRHCTDEDKKICGYQNVSDMTCEQFKIVKDCLHNRCSRDGFSLGSCED